MSNTERIRQAKGGIKPSEPKPITEVYAFEKGKHYIIEVDMRYISMSDIENLAELLLHQELDVLLVPTMNGKALHPVPAIEGTDLVYTDHEGKTYPFKSAKEHL